MNVVRNLISDLREKRLWPIAAALIVALIAVPVLLSSGASSSVPLAQAPAAGSSNPAVPALPAVSVTTTPGNARLTGTKRDPFTQQLKPKGTGSQTSASVSSTKPQGASGSSKAPTASTKPSTAGATTRRALGGSTTTVTSPPTTTSTPAPPAPTGLTGLTGKQSYRVTLAMSNAAGGLYTVDPVERLSLLPSPRQPLLIELGVLDGGHRVLFAVRPGTVVRGRGRCTPRPSDCEIVSLAPDQIEWVGTSGPSAVAGVALMAVTTISTADYSSAAAADKARRTESAAGRRLLSQSNLDALSLFHYRPSLGAVVRSVISGRRP